MTRFSLLSLLVLSGCSFDVSLLQGRDAALDSSVFDDAVVEASDVFTPEDAFSMADAFAVDTASDAGVDAFVGEDSPAFPDAPPDSGPASLTCTDIPDISGMYRLTANIATCYIYPSGGPGVIPLTRTGACTYEFEDGSPAYHVMDGPCTISISGSSHILECNITHGPYLFGCIITEVSGGLNVSCRYSRGPTPASASCSFFMPRVAT